MDDFQLGIAVVSALIFLLGLMGAPLANRFFASQPMLAMLLGVLLGPALIHVGDARGISEPVLEEISRIALGVGVMGIALQVPHTHLMRGIVPLWILILGVMPLSALVAAVLIGWIGHVPLLVAAAIGAVLCPTDPIVASSITASELAEESVPDPVRHLIEVESAANDGLAYPLLMIPLMFLMIPGGPVGQTLVVDVMVFQVLVGGIFGAVVGVVFGFGINWLEKRAYVSRDAFVAYPVALAIAVLSFAEVLHLSSVFAVFCAGVFLVLTATGRSLEFEVRARNTISQFFEIPLFFILGLLLPWREWAAMGWRAPVIALAVLLLRRIPAVLLLGKLIKPLRAWPERLFVGWFGPIGLSSMFYAAYAVRLTHLRAIWTYSTLVIFASVLVNGLTSTSLTRYYARVRPLETHDGEDERDAPSPDGDDARSAGMPH